MDILIAEGGVRQMAGGTAANVAANLAYLGWSATLLARLGNDTAGQAVARSLRRAHVSTRRLVLDESVGTPVVLHEVGSGGHSFSFRCPTCSAGLGRFVGAPAQTWDVAAALRSADVFFFDRTAAAAISLASAARKSGALVLFEPSVPGRGDSFVRAVRVAHIVKVSSERLRYLPAVSRDGRVVIETTGKEGLTWWVAGTRHRQPAFDVPLVDAGGAGDWLTAALLEALRGRSPSDLTAKAWAQALRQAQSFAALACTVPGARGVNALLSPSALRSRARRLRLGGAVRTGGLALTAGRSERPTCPDCHAQLPPEVIRATAPA